MKRVLSFLVLLSLLLSCVISGNAIAQQSTTDTEISLKIILIERIVFDQDVYILQKGKSETVIADLL